MYTVKTGFGRVWVSVCVGVCVREREGGERDILREIEKEIEREGMGSEREKGV